MKTKNPPKDLPVFLLFQGFLHLVLAIVQIAGFVGLPWILAHEGSTFYVTLTAWSIIAGIVLCAAGAVAAVFLWGDGQREKAVWIVLQSVGAFLSVYLYRSYLYRIADIELYSPARWMLTPYLAALFLAAALAAAHRIIKKQ